MSDLEKRVQALEDHRDVTTQIYQYAHLIDTFAQEAWLDLFTPDALYVARERAGPDREWADTVRLTAPEHYRGFIEGFTKQMYKPKGENQKNLLSEPVVRVDGDTASAITYFHLIYVIDGQRVIFAGGRYHDKFVRCADGVWRFSERISDIDSRAPLP